MQQVQQLPTRSTDTAAMVPPLRRQNRVYQRDGQWFFHVRDAADKGPFIDKQNAYWALARFIRRHAHV